MASMTKEERSDQMKPLTGATDEEPERHHARGRFGQRGLLMLMAFGVVALGMLTIARMSKSAPALRSPASPRASIGLSEEDEGSETKPRLACKKVYIDTDVGIDDNMALIASFGQHRLGNICIIGIGVTDGNIPAWISDYTFPRLLALFAMDDLPFSTPAVAEGKKGDMGLLFNDMDGNYNPAGGRGSAEHIHGKAGMGGLAEFLPKDPASDFPNQDKTGAPGAFLEQRLEEECGEKDCDILVMGPLTNIVAANKDILARRVGRVIWMGGSFVKPEQLSAEDVDGIDYANVHEGDWNVGLRRRGNIAPLSEFNAWAGSVPLAKFLTERDESVGFDIIPLDVTSKLMWSPQLVDTFEKAAGVDDTRAWNSKDFRDKLMKFRATHPGRNEENNKALGEEILEAFETALVARRKSNFTYPSTQSGRASFIRDISVKGWASTVADGQIPRASVANLAHDVSVLAYVLKGDLFDAGEVEDVSVVLKGKATDELWDQLGAEGFMQEAFNNSQWGAAGAPIGHDLKGAIFENTNAYDSQVMEVLTKEGMAEGLEVKTGEARVVQFAEIPGHRNAAETQVMEWLAGALAVTVDE